MISFEEKLKLHSLYPLKATGIETLQINVGKVCNQTCAHCHVEAGPHRRESMSWETMQACIAVLEREKTPTLDITGGAPELHPHFRELVEKARGLGVHVIVRCNLTIILANKKYNDLPQFYAAHKVEVISSLPHYTPGKTDRQRGEGVFEKSIRAIQMLNEVGYGMEDGLPFHLVYNPNGAFLPGAQDALERDFKEQLLRRHGVHFHKLYTITNMPVKRFNDFLHDSGNYDRYMGLLLENFNPAAAEGLMCKNLISVDWDGQLYDCDFNGMLGLGIGLKIADFSREVLQNRVIKLADHCYGCTAGAGSSCGGSLA